MKQVQNYLFVFLLFGMIFPARSQTNITGAEYFFDTDPGFGNGSPVSLPQAQDIQNHVFNANIASLSNGMHTLYMRSRSTGAAWSISNAMVIAKVQLPFTNTYPAGNISKAEYFYDTDPGLGNGTDIPLTASNNISGFVFNANVSTIHPGIHTLHVRTRDINSKWSATQAYVFAKTIMPYGNPHPAGNIVKAEYFYDADPGFGNGTDIPLSTAADISALIFNADVSALPNGIHAMCIRVKDANGKWSTVNTFNFAKVQAPFPNPNTLSNIMKMEYFFNTDPGVGNGTVIPVTAAADISSMIVNIPVASLSNAMHTLYIRTMDANGQWSITNHLQFSKIQGPSTGSHMSTKIVKAECFFDMDPGFGNGADIPLTPARDITGMVFQANTSLLSSGVHNLYVRTQDSLGQWSMSNVLSFAKVRMPSGNPYTRSNIVKMEYFYDADPGLGNGIDVPVNPDVNIVGMVLPADVAALPNGVHTLYLRTKDAQGKWSISHTSVFAKVQSPYGKPYTESDIEQIEYFVDTDPGIGNGVPLIFIQGANISNLSFHVDMTLLVNGMHQLFIRSKDAQGKWSITNLHEFNGGTAPLSVRLISFDASVQKDKTVLLEWTTAQEKDVARYTIERSADAYDWEYVGTILPVTATAAEIRSYRLSDETPGTGIVYYRLTEMDRQGNKTQAPIRFVNISGDETTATVYPNPNDGIEIHIRSSVLETEAVMVTILGTDGKIHFRKTVYNAGMDELSISGLQLLPGSYYINLQGKIKTESLKLQVTGNRF